MELPLQLPWGFHSISFRLIGIYFQFISVYSQRFHSINIECSSTFNLFECFPIEISYIIGIHLNYSVGFHLILNGAISSLKYHVSLGLRLNGIIFGRSVSHVATIVVPKFYTIRSQIGREQASAPFPLF